MEEFRKLRQELLKREGSGRSVSQPSSYDNKDMDVEANDGVTTNDLLRKPPPPPPPRRDAGTDLGDTSREVELSCTGRRTSSSNGEDSQQSVRRREPVGAITEAPSVAIRRTSSIDADGLILSMPNTSSTMNDGQAAGGAAGASVIPLNARDRGDSLLDDSMDEDLEDVPLEGVHGSERRSSQSLRGGIFFASPLKDGDLTIGDVSTESNNVATTNESQPSAPGLEHGYLAQRPSFSSPSHRTRLFNLQIESSKQDVQEDEQSETTHFHNSSLLRGSLDLRDAGPSSPCRRDDDVTPRVVLKEWSDLPRPPILQTSVRRQTRKFQLPDEDWASNDVSSTASEDSPRKTATQPSLADHVFHRRIHSDPNVSEDDVQHPASVRRGSGADQVAGPRHQTIGVAKTPRVGAVLPGLNRASHLNVSPITPGSRSNIPPPETLWERNKTLVNEVRFADQTCVELSMRNQALEEQLELLRQHNGSLEAVSGQDVERLRQRVVQLEAELKSSNEVREDLMRRLGRESLLTARVAELELADNEQRAIIAETVQKLRSVTSENASLTCKLAQATFGSAEASKDRVAEVEALTLELTQSAELVMQLMENTRRELEESKGVVEKVSSQHSILQDRVIELQASCKEQSIAALASERLLDQVTREKNNLAQAIVKLEADVHARDERISELVQLCRDHSSSSSAFEEQLNSLSQDKRRLEIDLEEAREKVTRMVLERNDLNHLKQEAEAKRDELLSQVACIEDELKTQSEDLERLRKAELRSENTVCRNVELESSLRASEDDKRGLESQLHSMQARIEDLSTREKLIVAEKLRLQGQLDLVQQELESQSRHLSTEAFDECSQLRDRVAELEAQKDSQRMEKTYLAADLDRSRKEVERLSSALASTQAAYESKVAVAEARLAESQSALASFQAECDLVLPRVGAAVTSALHQVDQQATALENRVSQSANDLAVRISNLQRDLHFFRESTDFQVESLKEDGASVDRELSTLTVNSVQTQSRGSARCPLHVIAVEEILNSTLESRSDRTTDLELMEEARFDLSRIARENDGRLSNDASDVTGDIDQDNASSIEGISHLFASGHEGELSFSASDHQHAEADAVDAFPAPTTQEANVPSTHTASAERSASKLDMEALLVDRDYRSRQLKNLEIDKARLEGELNDKIDLLGRATSCLALVREERDSLQFKLNELAATAQVPRANLSTPKDKSQTHQQLYSPFLSPLFPKKGEQTSDTYHERIDSRTRVVDALSIEWGALRSQLERLRTENDELTKDLRSTSSLLKQRSEVFASELKRQQERCDALERELSDGKNALKIAQAKADLLESEHIRVEQQAESLQRALSESDEKRHAQTLALDRLLEETKLAAKMRFNLEERVQADSQQREQAASESERLRRDLEFVNEKHNDSLNRIDELQKRVDALSREKEDVSSELVAIVSRNEELERERERRVLEASSSQTELQQLYRDTLATLAQANERLDALSEVESNLASAESENLRLQRAIEDVQQELETSRRALQDLQVELAQARAESDASSSDQRRRLDEQQRGRQDAEKALETKVLELTEAHAAIQVAEACLLDSNNARCGLEQTVLKCRERIASLERDQQDTAGVLEAKVHELAETRDALRMSEASLANVERDRLALEQTVQGCNERIALLDVSNRELLEKVSVREGELKKAREDAFHAGGLASHAEGRWVELQSELGRVRTERDDFMAKCLVFEEQLKLEAQENWDLQSDLKRCRGELESVQCDLEQAVESRDDANSELTARTVEIEELREQIQELSDTVEANRQKFSDAERNRGRVQEELAAVQAKKVKLESKCQGLRHYVNKLMLKCEEWQEYCSDQSKELGKIRDENEYIKKSIRERDQVLNVERAIWTTERSNLTLIHHTLEEEMDAVARELIDYNRPELS